MQPSKHIGNSSPREEEHKALYTELVEQLYSNAVLGMLASIVNALILAVIQRKVTSSATLIAWVAVLFVITLLRYRELRAFRRRSPQASEADYWSRRFIVGALLSGMAWGSSAIFLFPMESLAHQVFLVFVIGGMVAGAAAAFSSIMKAFLAYSVPAVFPIIARFALLGDEFHLAMAGMALLFWAMMFLIARRIQEVRVASVKLRFENTGLVSYLTALERTEKALREAHDQLELRVEERTEELRKAYENLKEETREREQAESQLRQAHKMEAIGTLAGGIAHDFNNMLAVIFGNAELALEEVGDKDSVRNHLRQILKASKRGRDLVKQILTFGRKSDRQRQIVKIVPLVEETFALLRSSIPSNIEMLLDVQADDAATVAEPSEIQQIIMNLASNAEHAMRDNGGRLTFRIHEKTFVPGERFPEPETKPGSYVVLTFSDTGKGMTAETSKNIFDPFFTTKEVGEGTGMGLAVVYGIVQNLNGSITVYSRPGQGTEFNVFLPKVSSAESEEREEESSVQGGKERLLFVDDEEPVAEINRALLESLGYRVTALTDSRKALRLFVENPMNYDLVITDQAMPHITGIQLAEEMLKVREDIPIILCTGYSHEASPERARAVGIRDFVMKPLS